MKYVLLVFWTLNLYANDTSDVDITKYPLNIFSNPNSIQFNQLISADSAKLAMAIYKENEYEKFDRTYQEFYFYCYEEDSKYTDEQCDQIQLFFDLIVSEYEKLSPLKKYEGPNLNQLIKIMTKKDSNMTFDSPTSSQRPEIVDSDRFQYAVQNSSAEKELIQVKNITCYFQNLELLKLDYEFLNNMSFTLEQILKSSSYTYEDRVEAFCTLINYYQITKQNDRLFLEVFPYAPDGENLCPVDN